MKRKYLIVTLILFNINVIVSAQKDTLQNFPFIYCFNCVETGVYHDSVFCTVEDNHITLIGLLTLHDTVLPGGWEPDEFTVHQHSNDVLHAVGIAFGYEQFEGYFDIRLSLYDSSMKAFSVVETESYTIYWPTWYTDSSYQILTLPGKTNPISWYDTTDMVLKYGFFNEPIDITGDFYVGITLVDINTHEHHFLDYLPFIYETHQSPYHIPDCDFRVRYHGDWYDGTLEHIMPKLFLIIEPECHSAENFRVATDSAGCVTVEWDTLKYQREWVLRLQGPGGTRYDTVETNNFTYCGLDTNAYYELSAMTKCYRPGGHNLSSWSDPVGFRNGTIAITEIENPKMTIDIHPNPASRQVVISATLPMTHIEATDILGHRLFDRPASGLTSTLDVSSWPAGTYLLRITTPSGVATKKLLVK